MATQEQRKAVAHESLQQTARSLLHCSHPDEERVGPNAKWCLRCGALHHDGRWIRPHLFEDIGDALKTLR